MKNPALSGGVFHNNTVEQKHWPLTRVFQATSHSLGCGTLRS
jgi:hypothetical protein